MFFTSVYSVCLSEFRFSEWWLSILQKNIGVSSILHTQEYQIYREELDIANDISHNPCNQNIDMFCNGLEVN